jgi:ribonuclease T2
MSKFVSRVFSVVAAVLTTAMSAAYAERFGHDEPGQFDFYVLSLSWSPSFCAAAAERDLGRRPSQQCGGRPYSFVVHGLWPQHEKGFPEYCQAPAPRLNRNIVSSMLDLMPAPGLIYNEWDKHGTCSGLASRAYFNTVRKARAVVKIPEEYTGLQEPLTVTPGEVAEAIGLAVLQAGLSHATSCRPQNARSEEPFRMGDISCLGTRSAGREAQR